ncbi:uncharacterized protein RSE6_08929 [Rhynchosporium secalis]|uniref:Large ribosomal subunit protein mL50 n=1 Tax=Rhynchosporium secalis TaxID=38038 RepID=A0A1E1MGP5_RHYSE|nr:uncharacterized protein RSE6_08929 [Rhynchosporium secalis]
MRRISRLHRPIDLLRLRKNAQSTSTYLCSACKHHASPFTTSALRAAQDGKVSLTDKLRRKIWGTDSPPGLDDPYGDKSVFDQTKKNELKRRKEQEVAIRLNRQKDVEKPVEDPSWDDYTEASTWDGMETVGSTERPFRRQHKYQAFVPKKVMTDGDEITAALHRAMVEVFALQEAGRPLGSFHKGMPGQDMTLDITFDHSPSGPVLKFMDEAPPLWDIVNSITKLTEASNKKREPKNPKIPEQDVAADRSTADPLKSYAEKASDETLGKGKPTESEEDVAADRSSEDPLQDGNSLQVTYEELIASWGQAWLQVSLENPEMKFAVLKRFMQLTGIRIPDAHLGSSRTASALLKSLIVQPKPRKLVEALSQKEDLVTLPNVSIFAKRITPIQKERSLGRWKVIEEELQKRGLPVTGHETRVRI